MGKAQGSKFSTELKKIQESWNTLNCTPEATKRSISNRTSEGVPMRVENAKGRKVPDHSKAQVIASILTRHRSRKEDTAASKPNLRSAQSSPSTHCPHTPRELAKKLVTRTSQPGGFSKFSKKSPNPDPGRYNKDKWEVSSKAHKGSSANHVARLLRSRTQPKLSNKFQPKRLEPAREAKKRQRKRKSRADEPHQDDMSRIKKRVKYLLNRMNIEQNLIDAYSAEGWKGQSREKIRPERELQRAKAQILQFQLGIRDAIQQLDCLGLQGTMKEYIFDSQGQIYHEDIFCAKCKRQDAAVNNDIILCDGFCDRAFHQLCLAPPLRTDDIPPDDEGWLCPVCECKLECLDVVNAYLGTSYCMEDHWQNIFAEAAALASGDGKLAAAVEELPSEDSEDDDYNPDHDNHQTDRHAKDQEGSGEESASATSGEGGDSDSDSSDDGDSKVSLLDELAGIMENEFDVSDGLERKNCLEELALTDEDNVVLVNGKRQRKEVDYKKLHDEMFGKSTLADEVSEDEEWGPGKRLKKSRQPGQVSQSQSKENHTKGDLNGDAGETVLTKSSGILQNKQGRVCLPPCAVEKLRAVFKENPLPSKACKEGLSKQLGISFGKVHVWFKNVRSAALKKGLVQRSKARAKHSLGSTRATRAEDSSQVKNKITVSKGKIKAQDDCWLAAMAMLSEAQIKVEKLKLLLQETIIEAHDCGSLMYVAVAELKEKAQF